MVKNFNTTFRAKNLTGNAGLVLVGRFARKLGLDKLLQQQISISRGANAIYAPFQIILMVMMGALAGAKHISHLVILRNDSVLRKIFKWDLFPVASTFGRIFKLFTHRHCDELSRVEDAVRRKVWSSKFFGRITLDLDSTVKGVYGGQEGAAKGFNPKKKGQKSYHPLMCFIAETRECLHNWFRCGNAFSANGSVQFMKECLARVPKRVWKIVVRADSAFFSGELLDFLESNSCLYTIKVSMKNIKSLLEIQKWRKIPNRPGFECAVFEYKCSGWSRPRQFVAIRVVKEIPSQDALFPGPIIQYEYFCYVTNMNLTPWGTHKFYGQRATSENWIEWCKNQMGAGSMLTQVFWANSAMFQTCVMAYNLLVWMMWLGEEKGFGQEPNTIRMFLIRSPALLRRPGRGLRLDLEMDSPFKEPWRRLEDSISNLSFA